MLAQIQRGRPCAASGHGHAASGHGHAARRRV